MLGPLLRFAPGTAGNLGRPVTVIDVERVTSKASTFSPRDEAAPTNATKAGAFRWAYDKRMHFLDPDGEKEP